tara:strand:- start:285 stop:785 length:501 start_codon:yes stop_codon:yes gene_type:complete
MKDLNFLGSFICDGKVSASWIDVNKHMNVAYYVLAFDYGIDALWERFGINESYIKEKSLSTFGVECHVNYLRELHENDEYFITTQILAYDEKRIHQFQRMYHLEKRFLAATAEWMNLHVDLEARRVEVWPEEVLEKIEIFCSKQNDKKNSDQVGGKMGIKNPLYSL